jgi:hypothetical protein
VGIFGRKTGRQRTRRATRESLAMPSFSSPIDCGPWVIGGLWPAELSTITDETATLAKDLKDDLQRITSSANDELKMIKRTGMAYAARQAEEVRVVDQARGRAVRRVESALRHFHTMKAQVRTDHPAMRVAERFAGTDIDKTQVIPAVAAVESASKARHRAPAVDTPKAAVETEPDSNRLHRLLAFVVRQEPRLNWAVGDYADGTTALVTDLAHGWIPPGITLPATVRLLEPERRTGNISALLGDTARAVTYTPGDSVGRSADVAVTEPSVQSRELPAVEDLGGELGRLTHRRDGLPRIVHTLAKAAAARTGVVAEEVDLLRVHLDTARYQLLTQYPDIDPALLLNCLLLAATASSVDGDAISANYHFTWFQKLEEPPTGQWSTNP